MANLTADRVTVYEAEDKAVLNSAVAATGSSWFKGALLAFNTSGLIVRAADTAGFRIAGEALDTVTSSAAGDIVRFRYGHIMALGYTGTWSSGGAPVLDACMLDDNLVTNGTTATNDIRVGRVTRMTTELGTNVAFVKIGDFSTAAFAGT